MGYIVCIFLIIFGVSEIYKSAKKETNSGCLGSILGTIIILLIIFSALR